MPIGVRRGFTLLEISIVLVIIGPVAGGVVVGRDLIKVATARRVVSQIEATRAAVNSFRVKYGQLPGDFDSASVYWPSDSPVDGNNNGIFEDDGNATFEEYNAWHHMALAGLVTGGYAPTTTAPPLDNPLVLSQSFASLSYKTALDGVYLHFVYEDNSVNDPLTPRHLPGNYLTLHISPGSYCAGNIPIWGAGVSSFVDLLMGTYSRGMTGGLWPSDAQYIDSKIDDGLPYTGSAIVPLIGMGFAAFSCPTMDGITNRYSLDSVAGWGNCGLWIRM